MGSLRYKYVLVRQLASSHAQSGCSDLPHCDRQSIHIARNRRLARIDIANTVFVGLKELGSHPSGSASAGLFRRSLCPVKDACKTKISQTSTSRTVDQNVRLRKVGQDDNWSTCSVDCSPLLDLHAQR